jgi:outer membrane lipoprotein SlyB
MRKYLLVLPAVTMLAACETTDQSTLAGTAVGAAIGSQVAGDRTDGALVGAAVGAVAGHLVGRANEPGRCVYHDSRGNRYVADCPR